MLHEVLVFFLEERDPTSYRGDEIAHRTALVQAHVNDNLMDAIASVFALHF